MATSEFGNGYKCIWLIEVKEQTVEKIKAGLQLRIILIRAFSQTSKNREDRPKATSSNVVLLEHQSKTRRYSKIEMH